MNQPPTVSSFAPKPHNPYARMPQRRAIACTTCAKAKTKCDKAVPSCSRCTAKGLCCEPRSTRRTSDNSYRNNPKKHLVSPKRYPTVNSIPSMARHTSPRSIPSSNRSQIARAVSQMDFHTAVKMNQQQNLSGFPMLTPLPTNYSPQIVDECYSNFSSPPQSMEPFPSIEKNNFPASGRLTPQTPESLPYQEPLSIADPFDPYMSSSSWSDDGLMPVGLGFENDMPGMMPGDMWTPEPEGITPMGAWPQSELSVSPPSLSEIGQHTRGVPSLSMSDCSVDDFSSPNLVQEEWSNFAASANLHMGAPATSQPFMEGMKSMQGNAPIWEDVFLPRSSTY